MRVKRYTRLKLAQGVGRNGHLELFMGFLVFLFLCGSGIFGCKSPPSPAPSAPKQKDATGMPARWEALFQGDPESLKEFQSIQSDFRSSDYKGAAKKLQAMLNRSPEAPWAEVVTFQQALATRMRGDYNGALVQLDSFLKQYPDSPEASKAMLSKGEIFLQMGRGSKTDGPVSPVSKLHFDKAIRIFRHVQKQYPADRGIQAKAEYSIGNTYMVMEDFQKARQAFQRISDEYADTPYAAKAMYLQAEVCVSEGNMDGAERIYGETTNRFPDTRYAKKAKKKLEGLGLVGNKAPRIQASEWIGDPPPEVKDYKGKTILLNFWAIWCPHCKRNIPKMERFLKRYASQGLEVVGISRERKGFETDKIREYVEKHHLSFPTAVDEVGKTSRSFSVTNIPRAVIVDSEGKVRWYGHPDRLTEVVVEGLLKGSS